MEEEYTPSLQDMRNAFALFYVHGNIYEVNSKEWRECLAWAEAAFDRGFAASNMAERMRTAEAKLAQIREILEQE